MIREELKKQLTSQLEYAREQKFRQDKMRFAFPAAFLVYLGSLIAIFKPFLTLKNSTEPIYLILALISFLIGFGIFFITIYEHYHYCRNRDLEISIDNFLVSHILKEETEDENAARILISGQVLKNFGDFPKSSREKYEKYNMNLAQHTIFFILFILSILNGLLFSTIIVIITKQNYKETLIWIPVTLLISAIQLFIYKYWHLFFEKCMKHGILKFFRTSKTFGNILFLWLLIFLILAVWILYTICCT